MRHIGRRGEETFLLPPHRGKLPTREEKANAKPEKEREGMDSFDSKQERSENGREP